MFEKQKTIGEGCDYATLEEAFEKAPAGTHLLIKPGEYHFDHELVFNKSFALQTDDDEKLATLIAPSIKFNMEPSCFAVFSRVNFDGYCQFLNGCTASFEVCDFTSKKTDKNAIITVNNSAPTFRFCKFHDFPKYGIDYVEGRGGICTDCEFVNIGCEGDPIKITPPSRPFHEHYKKL